MLRPLFDKIALYPSQHRKLIVVRNSLIEEEWKTETLIQRLVSSFIECFPGAPILSDDVALQQALLSQGEKKTKNTSSFLAQVSPLRVAKELLGATLPALLLDFRRGFALDYFMSASNAVASGGVVLLIGHPPLGIEESTRFHEVAIESPYFEAYLAKQLQQFAYRISLSICGQWHSLQPPHYLKNFENVVGGDQNQSCREGRASASSNVHYLNSEQQIIYTDFLMQPGGVYTLFSPRGTGKSWLGAALIKEAPHKYILTAPNQFAITQYKEIEDLQFYAPDALFLEEREEERQEILIIEEAAKMPLRHLERLCRCFNKVLMLSSVENYEGTGQGLREKIYDLVPITREYQLHQKERFSSSDPLYRLGAALMFMKKPLSNEQQTFERDFFLNQDPSSHLEIECFHGDSLTSFRDSAENIREFYHLMNETHYQTNAQDVRRLWDAPGQIFMTARWKGMLIGAIWAIEEGGQTAALSLDLFRGLRRPKGNLVPQMLASQSYYPEAMVMRSVRISRISVISEARRLGIGSYLVQAFKRYIKSFNRVERERQGGKQIDFLSVSFGLTKGLLSFWESCDLHWIHVGSHADKTTGLHAAVVILPFSKRALDWSRFAVTKFKGDAYYLKDAYYLREDTRSLLGKISIKTKFDARDSSVLEAYRDFKRSKYSVYCAKQRYGSSDY